MDLSDNFSARIRAKQADYPEAHQALINWGLYSRDRAGFQRGLTRSQALSQYRYNEGDEGFAPEPEGGVLLLIRTDAPAKAEKVIDEPYDEKTATILDERIHGYGGLQLDCRPVIKVAYVLRDVPEYQYPTRTGLLPDTVVERLEAALRFCQRFA